MPDTIWLPDLGRFDGPKYLALTHALRDAVRAGELAKGDRLPPVRDLAWRLGMTPGTVARAYQIVTQEGLLEAAVGRGTFVAATRPKFGAEQALLLEPLAEARLRAPGGDTVIDLRSPQLPDVGQNAAIGAVYARMAAEGTIDYLGYPGLKRDGSLRAAYADWLGDRDLGTAGADDIVLTQGGQNAIGLALQCCLKGPRPQVMLEELAYPGFRHAARLNRAEVVPVTLDGEGVSPRALDEACRRSGARILCVTTEAHNPTTVRMPLARRVEIVRVARHHDLQIIEDDCYSVGAASAPSLRALAPERTWYITSVSKSLVAGLRFGCIVCPAGQGEYARLAAQHSYFGIARPVADVMLALFTSGEAARLRDAAEAVLERRLELALNALGTCQIFWQKGLAFLWLKLPQGWRASTFMREAESAGVLVRSADEYALVDAHAPNAIRIAIDGRSPEPAFVRALETMARLLRNPPGDLPV